jgi:hypothetical protein
MPVLKRIGLSEDFIHLHKDNPEFIRRSAKQLGKIQLQEMHPNAPKNIQLAISGEEKKDEKAIKKLEANRQNSIRLANDLTILDARQGTLIERHIQGELEGSQSTLNDLEQLKIELRGRAREQENRIGLIHRNYSTLISRLFEEGPKALGHYRFLVKRFDGKFCLIEFKPNNSLEIREQKGAVEETKQGTNIITYKSEEGKVLICDSYLIKSKFNTKPKYIKLSDTPQSLEGIKFLGIMAMGDKSNELVRINGPTNSSYPSKIRNQLIVDFVLRLRKNLPIHYDERKPDGNVIGYKLIPGSEPEFYNLGTFTRIIKKNSP